MDFLLTQYFGQIEVKMKSEMGDNFMAQFVCGTDIASPKNRGHFRCEIPNATNSSVNQTLYTNIKFCEFC